MVVTSDYQAETIRALGRNGYEPWFARRRHVSPARNVRAASARAEGPLTRFMIRQLVRGTAEVREVPCRHHLLEDLLRAESQLRLRIREESDSGLSALALRACHLSRRLKSLTLPALELEEAEIRSQIKRLSNYCDEVRRYEQAAEDLYQVLTKLAEPETPLPSRMPALLDLLEQQHGQPFLLAHSTRAARALAERLPSCDRLKALRVVTARELRIKAPVETLIVPGWGNRELMRELTATGLAEEQHWLFYPFETRWASKSREASERRTRYLETNTQKARRDLGLAFSGHWQPAPLPQTEDTTAARLDDIREPTLDEMPQEDWLSENEEQLATQLLRTRPTTIRDSATKAILVFFEEPGCYALLPKDGKAIDLCGHLEGYDSLRPDKKTSSLEVKVADIRAGALLAFPEKRSGDVLDALMEELFPDQTKLRRSASHWRTAIVQLYERFNRDAKALARHLEGHGIKRKPSTIPAMGLQHQDRSTEELETASPSLGRGLP